jgi:hypothetical protein
MPKNRHRNDFRPLPENLRRLRYGELGERKALARFYALFIEMNGLPRRASFSVKVKRGISNAALAFLIRATVQRFKECYVPEHVQGEVMSDFLYDLFNRPWRKVRRVEDYKAGVVYVR